MNIHLSTFKPRRQAGFTLAEIVIVMTIIVILSGGAFFAVKGFIGDAQYTRVESDLQKITTALEGYERNNYFKPPSQEQGLKALVEEPTSDPKPKRWSQYLEEMPLDPWGNEYQYRIPAQKSGKKYDLFSMGENGVEDEDDIGNW